MSVVVRLVLGILFLLFAAGCQTARPLYFWGHYEATLYQGYSNPGKVSSDEQMLKLQEDVTKATAAGLPVHPGLHAQIGFLYFEKGQTEAARKEFEIEKSLFPEAAVLMDRMLQKIQPPAAK